MNEGRNEFRAPGLLGWARCRPWLLIFEVAEWIAGAEFQATTTKVLRVEEWFPKSIVQEKMNK